jgi:anthranilate synthase component I
MAAEGFAAGVQPSLEEFGELARQYSVVPVWRHYSADLQTPVATFLRLCPRDASGFLLESVEHAERWSRWSFVGRRPAAILQVRGRKVRVVGDPLPPGVRLDEGALAVVEDLLEHHRSPQFDELPPLHGGLVGYLGYDIVREVETLGTAPSKDSEAPDAVLSLIGDLVAFDHLRQRMTLISNAFIPPDADEEAVAEAHGNAVRNLQRMVTDLGTPLSEPLVPPPDGTDPLPHVSLSMTSQEYRAAVDVAKEHILAGDIFQVVLSQRFGLELDAEPVNVYRVLRQTNPSPYMYFVRTPQLSLVGSSPEPMVQVLGGRVISRPIAGTRPRGETGQEDRRLGAELIENPKERAEHVMLVDLARNDVGRVVAYGSEHMDELMTLERYSHVMHLTSQVSGDLAPGLGPVDVLRATLPAGTVSGAPKVRAMQIIDELEPVRRGPYAGVVGYLDFSGNVDTAIAIRTMVVEPDGWASVQAGAGIVADSDPQAEDAECHAKARALLAAVPPARRMSEQRRGARSGAGRRNAHRAALQLRSGVAFGEFQADAIVLEGEEVLAFLDGQVTQDVKSLAPGDSRWSFLLQPDGKVVALLRIWNVLDGPVVVALAPGQLDAVQSRLERFMIRVDCRVKRTIEGAQGLSVRGPRSSEVANSTSGLMGTVLPSPHEVGFDLVMRKQGALSGVPHAPEGALEALRIEAGWPLSGVDILPGDVPADAGPDVMATAVSFTKGCYTGQELVERMAARGASSPRPLRLLTFEEDDPVPPPGSEVTIGDESYGTITSSAFSPWRKAPVALARIPRRVAPPAVAGVRTPDGDLVARLVNPPLR